MLSLEYELSQLTNIFVGNVSVQDLDSSDSENNYEDQSSLFYDMDHYERMESTDNSVEGTHDCDPANGPSSASYSHGPFQPQLHFPSSVVGGKSRNFRLPGINNSLG